MRPFLTVSAKKLLDKRITYGKNILPMSAINISYVEKCLLECILEIQRMSGEEEVPIKVDTCPLKDLAGFDSLRGVETTTYLSIKLNVVIASDGQGANLFVSPDGRRALTVREIAQRMVTLIAKRS